MKNEHLKPFSVAAINFRLVREIYECEVGDFMNNEVEYLLELKFYGMEEEI
jgi:hypothetical protein